jgi:hypothetical protein
MALDYLNYQQAVDPVQKALAGYQAGSAFGQNEINTQIALDDRQLKMQQAIEQKQQMQQMQTDLADLSQSKNASASDYALMIAKYPTMAEHFTKSYEMIVDERRDAAQSQSLNIFSALNSGQTDVAKSLLNRQIEASKNSGDQEAVDSANAMLMLVEANPDAARTAAGLSLSATMGEDKFGETWVKLQDQDRQNELQKSVISKAAADLGYTEAQTQKELKMIDKIEADISKTNVDAKSVAYDTKQKQLEFLKSLEDQGIKLTTTGENLVNEAVQNQVNLNSLSRQYENLANEITTEINSGTVAGVEEQVKKIFGSEDSVTRLRQEYRRLRNSQVLQTLPPGVASDKDIEIAMGAFPSDNANPELIASFLRGMSKLNKYDASISGAKSEWVSQVGSLRPATKNILINGQLIQPGTSFNKAMGSIFEQGSAFESKSQSVPSGVPSYMKYSTGGQ